MQNSCTEFHRNPPRNVERRDINSFTTLSNIITTVTETIFTKFRLVQRVFMQNSYTEFHRNPPRNVERRDINSFTTLSNIITTVTETIFTKFRLVQRVFMQNSCTEFHYNPIQVLLDGGETWVSLQTVARNIPHSEISGRYFGRVQRSECLVLVILLRC